MRSVHITTIHTNKIVYDLLAGGGKEGAMLTSRLIKVTSIDAYIKKQYPTITCVCISDTHCQCRVGCKPRCTGVGEIRNKVECSLWKNITSFNDQMIT